MQSAVKKWGNSAAVRIPANVLAAAGLKMDQTVEVREEAGHIVIAAARREYTLEEFCAAITPDNMHAEVDWGAPVGREIW